MARATMSGHSTVRAPGRSTAFESRARPGRAPCRITVEGHGRRADHRDRERQRGLLQAARYDRRARRAAKRRAVIQLHPARAALNQLWASHGGTSPVLALVMAALILSSAGLVPAVALLAAVWV